MKQLNKSCVLNSHVDNKPNSVNIQFNTFIKASRQNCRLLCCKPELRFLLGFSPWSLSRPTS